MIELIGRDCCSQEEKEAILNIKYIFIEVARLSHVVSTMEAPKGLAFEIYSRFFITIKIPLTQSQQKQSQIFPATRTEPTTYPHYSPQIPIKIAVQNLIKILSERGERIAFIIHKSLYFDLKEKCNLYFFVEKFGEIFGAIQGKDVVGVSGCLYGVDYWFQYLGNNQVMVNQDQRIGGQQKINILTKFEHIFQKFINSPDVRSTIDSSAQLRIHSMTTRARFDFQKGKTADQMKDQMLTIFHSLQPFPNQFFSLVASFITLFGYLQSYLYTPGDHYSKQILLHISQRYIEAKHFYLFQKKRPILGDVIRIKNEQGRQEENLDMILKLIAGMRNADEASMRKISNQTFIYVVKIFCATLRADKVEGIYDSIKLDKKELSCLLYGYLVFEVFLRAKGSLSKNEQLQQVIRTTLCLGKMPLIFQIKVKAELLRMYKHLVAFRSKRKAFICQKLEMRSTLDANRNKVKSLIRDLQSRLQKISHKNMDHVVIHFMSKIQKLETAQFFNNSQILAKLNSIYYSYKF